jgi:hypothetical protein
MDIGWSGHRRQGGVEVAIGLAGTVRPDVDARLVGRDATEQRAVDRAHDEAPSMPRMLFTYAVVCA